MKKILLFFNLAICLVSPAQVRVTLQSKYLENLVNLDSIIVENLTQPGRLSLVAPPVINSYDIDLMQGKIINDVSENRSIGKGFHERINMPGKLQVSLTLLKQEMFSVSLFTTGGEIVRHWEIECGSGINLIDISVGSGNLFICSMVGKEMKGSFKILGKDQVNTDLKLAQGIIPENVNGPVNKSGTDFVFTLGDGVRFTAFKNGMYRNAITTHPQNKDSVLIYLSIPCPGLPDLSDFDGNLYSTVLIGNQCWMRENLRSKHYADGTSLVDGTGAGDIYGDYTTKYWFDYDDNPVNSDVYGRLYSGAAAMNGSDGLTGEKIQGVCPNGWHVSRATEWCEMEMLLDTTIKNCLDIAPHEPWIGTTIWDKLCETDTLHWLATFPGFPGSATDESGFNALPGGLRADKVFGYLNAAGQWWALDAIHGSLRQPRRVLDSWYDGIYRDSFMTCIGLSVRCVKN